MEQINWVKHLYLWCKMKGYSMENTFPVYRDTLNKVLRKFPHLEEATITQIQEYAISIENENTRKNTLVVIRWAFNTVLKKPIDWRDLPYPKRKRKVQPIYSEQEVATLFSSLKNEKQKAIFALLVDCGLRASEPCSILLSDCFIDEQKIIIRSCKGGKDRTIYPSEYVWGLLSDYIETWHTTPTKYLFEGAKKQMPYTKSSIRQFVERSCKIAGVEFKGLHSFRRFNGTWKVQNGIPETIVADMLGHSSVKPLHKHYLIHSPFYLKNLASPLMKNNLQKNLLVS